MIHMPAHDETGQQIPAGDDSEYVTIREAAAAVGIPLSTFQGWVNRGRFKKFHRGVSPTILLRLAEVREKVAIRPVEEGDA